MTYTEWGERMQALLRAGRVLGDVVFDGDNDAVYLCDLATIEDEGVDLSYWQEGDPGVYVRVTAAELHVEDLP